MIRFPSFELKGFDVAAGLQERFEPIRSFRLEFDSLLFEPIRIRILKLVFTFLLRYFFILPIPTPLCQVEVYRHAPVVLISCWQSSSGRLQLINRDGFDPFLS